MRKQAVACLPALVWLVLAAPASAQIYHQTNIVSDGSVPALLTDPNLKDPWGMSFTSGSPFWVSDQFSNFKNASTGNSSSVSTLYSIPSNGNPPSIPGLIVNIPNQGNTTPDPNANGPTGQVATGAPGITTIGTDFQVVGPNGGTTHQASFIFANQDGSISAWAGGNSGTPIANTTATLETTTIVAGASFTGLAIANNPAAAVGGASGAQIYAADQNSGNVVVFNSAWQKIGTLTDPTLPAGFVAFNVQNIGGTLYVTYSNPSNTVGGLVAEFKPDGTFIKTLIDNSTATQVHGSLDQPWGITLAPTGFGKFGGDLLVGNNGGDNWINAFNPTTGAFVGSLQVDTGGFFREGNLWALTFGNGTNGGNANILYFDAGLTAIGDEGLIGSLQFIPEPGPIALFSVAAVLSGGVALVRRIAPRRRAV
jgi:uncharacterized protein (TIGR03118 family)